MPATTRKARITRAVTLVAAGVTGLALAGCGAATDDAASPPSSVAPSSSSSDSPAVSPSLPPAPPRTWLLPGATPPGQQLYISQISFAPNQGSQRWPKNTGAQLNLYGEADRADPAAGPLLAGVYQKEEYARGAPALPCQDADAVRTKVGSRHGPVVSVRGAYWVCWPDPHGDEFSTDMAGVMGRGVPAERVGRAADTATLTGDVDMRTVRLSATALPTGITHLATGPVSTRTDPVIGDELRWTDTRAGASLSLRFARGDADRALLARVAVAGTPTRIRGGLGAIGARTGGGRNQKVTWREGDLVVGLTAVNVDRADVDRFVRSLRKASPAQVEELRATIPRRPPEQLLGPDQKLALGGRDDQAVWAVGVSSDFRYEYVYVAHEGSAHVGGSEGSYDAPGPSHLRISRVGSPDGELVVAQVDATVARVVLSTKDGKRTDLPLAASVTPDGSRYGGAWLEASTKFAGFTLYDANGKVIPQR